MTRSWCARVPAAMGLAALAWSAACVPPSVRATLPAPAVRPRALTVRVQFREAGALVVRDVPLEEYVTATVLSEVDPPTAAEDVIERMYEVQAVISRTYALANRDRHARDGFDLCSTTHCQLFQPQRLRTSRWASAARRAAQRTDGELLWFASAPARAVFHADCGGHTSAATEVWGGDPRPYLVAARDAGPADKAHVGWRCEVGRAALRNALNGDARTSVGRRLDRIEVAWRDAAGRAERVTIRGERVITVRGEVFRDALTKTFGARSVRSTLFSVRRSGDTFAFTGRGFGHGVGLCQAGALARLRAGASPAEVLNHYFPGTTIHP